MAPFSSSAPVGLPSASQVQTQPGTSEQQTGDTQSRQETPAKPKY